MTHRSSPVTDDQYRKKPVVIRAWRLGSEEARPEWAKWAFGNGHDYAEVQTLEGTMRGNRGDWIIQGVKGELYFCKPDIFAATYEPASSPAQCAPTDPLTDLVERFSKALLAKLRLAEANGRSGWDRDDWEKQCQEGLLRHVDKGDPRDVAAYCAFMWHHGWITALTSTEQYDPAFVEEIKRAAAAPPEAEFSNAQEALDYLNGIAPLPGLVTTLRSHADDCEDMERWAVPELSPLLRRAADVIEAGVSPVTSTDGGGA